MKVLYYLGKHFITDFFGNPKGPVKLGNANTCAKTKLASKFYFILAQEVVRYEPEAFIQFG